MKLRNVFGVAVLAAAGAGFALPSSAVEVGGVIILDRAPPAPRSQPPPPPRTGYVWSPGYWAWNGSDYQWQEGRWVAEQPGPQTWVPDHWEQRDGRWQYVPGHWES